MRRKTKFNILFYVIIVPVSYWIITRLLDRVALLLPRIFDFSDQAKIITFLQAQLILDIGIIFAIILLILMTKQKGGEE